jgi:hypothetical protein
MWALLVALLAPATVTVTAEITAFEGGPHCGILHVISGARLRVQTVESGSVADEEPVVFISCAEMSLHPSRLARYTLTRTRPRGWPAGSLGKSLLAEGQTPWYLIRQQPLWAEGYGRLIGQPAERFAKAKTPFTYEVNRGRIAAVKVRVPSFLQGPRKAAMWMGFPPRKGLAPFKRKERWVWPADNAARRLAPGIEGQLHDGWFTVRRVGSR